MQVGTDKRSIKIKASIIYLNGNKHAQVLNNCLQYYGSFNQFVCVATGGAPDQSNSPEPAPSQPVSNMNTDPS